MKRPFKKLIFAAATLIIGAFVLLPLSAIERPDYKSIKKDGDFEIRSYDKFVVASTPMKSMRGDNQSFGRLFKYISGENEAKQKIAMTAPVIMNEGDEGKMRFVVPKDVVKGGTPKATGEEVAVETIPGGQFAVLKFAKGREQESRDQAFKDLAARLTKEGKTPIGEPFFSFYDPPYKPSALCTFEVWQRLTKDD